MRAIIALRSKLSQDVIDSGQFVASLDRKRLGADSWGEAGTSIRGVFDKETRRKPLAFAADAVAMGFERRVDLTELGESGEAWWECRPDGRSGGRDEQECMRKVA